MEQNPNVLNFQEQEQRTIENCERSINTNTNRNEEIPLNRLTSTEQRAQETAQRQKVYNLFRKYDIDDDNQLNVKELKAMIATGSCRGEMCRGLTRNILKMNDRNGDHQLNFEEFYELWKNNQWIFPGLVGDYCKMLVVKPNREVGDQIDGAYEEEITICPPPLTMICFSIIEIIFFLVDVLYFQDDPSNTKKIGENTNGPAASLFIYNPYRRYEAWRFVTYMFVHVGTMHLFMNLIVQVFLGVALELVHNWWRVALIYLAGVIAGSMGTSLQSPTIYLAGASGGVYALVTAHIATIILNWQEMEVLNKTVQLLVFSTFCISDLYTSISNHINDQNDKIGYMAHLCGAIAGLLVGFGVLRNLKVRRWEIICWWISVLIYCSIMATGIFIHILYPDYFPNQHFN